MIMVDTSVIVEILRKTDRGINFLDNIGEEILITSEITIMELNYGLYGNKFFDTHEDLLEQRKIKIESILDHFQIFQFDRKSAIKTAQIMGELKKEGNLIDFRDGMIAGISLANGITRIATINIKHFQRIRNITLFPL